MRDLLILNAITINENSSKQADIWIKNGRIEAIASNLSHMNCPHILDAKGKTLLPGMIDDQVHFREPGLTHKGDFYTESRAAVAGGITSFMEMPNSKPPTLNAETLEAKYQLAAEKSFANYAFYLGASNDNLEAIKSLNPHAACGVKIFMGASTGNMLVDNPLVLEQIFAYSPILIATHCEDTPTILENEKKFQQQYGENVPIACHPKIRSAEACYKSSSYAVSLANKHSARLHVLHLTTAKELDLFSKGPRQNKKITAEVCAHHLFFNEQDYPEKGNLIKCNPAIKTRQDQLALQQAVIDNIIDVIATDHAPHTWEEKQKPYLQAPSGLPLVQYALLSLLEHYHNNLFSLELIVDKTSHAPADLYQIVDRGYIREGYWADLTLINLHAPFTVKKEAIVSKCHWSPFENYVFRSTIDTTIINGAIAYQNGNLNQFSNAQRLLFSR